jgi:oligopeptide transport system ATP-binding protein
MRPEPCTNEVPPLYDVAPGRGSACHFWQEVLDGTDG